MPAGPTPARVYNAQQALSAPTQILNSVPTLLNGLSAAVILVFGGLLIMDGRMTVGMLRRLPGTVQQLPGPHGRPAGSGQHLPGDQERALPPGRSAGHRHRSGAARSG
ncbi:MAG: hypothetical protein R3A10_02080 [Caldilineaceae bacterium]